MRVWAAGRARVIPLRHARTQNTQTGQARQPRPGKRASGRFRRARHPPAAHASPLSLTDRRSALLRRFEDRSSLVMAAVRRKPGIILDCYLGALAAVLQCPPPQKGPSLMLRGLRGVLLPALPFFFMPDAVVFMWLAVRLAEARREGRARLATAPGAAVVATIVPAHPHGGGGSPKTSRRGGGSPKTSRRPTRPRRSQPTPD